MSRRELVSLLNLDELVYIPARHQRARTRPAVSICIHTIENAETPTGAENCARYFANLPPKPEKGAHFCIDNDSIVMSVDPRKNTTPHCYGPSAWSVGLEHAGRAAQTAADWHDDYSQDELDLSARLSATLCKLFGIPVVKLKPAQVAAGERGFFGHFDATLAVNKSGGHTDPGVGFPWGEYLNMVREYLAKESPVPPPDTSPILEEDEMFVPFNKRKLVPGGLPRASDGRWPQFLVDSSARAVHGLNGVSFTGAPVFSVFGRNVVDLSGATTEFLAAELTDDGRLVISGPNDATYTLGFIL